VAIVGRPNVGKSSLLNLLSRSDRAIVTDLPGTTRDLVESELVLKGVPLTLLDTAGIRDTEDRVEQIGIERSRGALQAADVVLLLFDRAQGWLAEDQALLASLPQGIPYLVVANKADQPAAEPAAHADVCISALTGEGHEALVDRLLQSCGQGGEQGLQVALNRRQLDLAVSAAASLQRTLEAGEQQLPWDFWTIDLRAAVRSLGEITGAEVTEAVLDRIFSRFCIGK
jgi:tRNA modification GTPase